jgi:phosphonate transport system ATP-binding protein
MINIHAVELARMFCDRVVGIANGVVVFDGPVSDLDQAAMDRIYRFDKEPTAPVMLPIREPELVPAGA